MAIFDDSGIRFEYTLTSRVDPWHSRSSPRSLVRRSRGGP